MIMDWNLLKPGGLLVADNVLYRGLPAEIADGVDLREKYMAKEGAEVISQKTAMNAEALVRFNSLVKDDVKKGSVRSLMLPVRDGMMAIVNLSQARPPPVSIAPSVLIFSHLMTRLKTECFSFCIATFHSLRVFYLVWA
jgi:hypothetical protein